MADEDYERIDLNIENVLARLNSYIQDENTNLEETNIAKLLKKQIEPLKGLWTQLHSYTARDSLHLVVGEKIDAVPKWLIQRIPVPEVENLKAHLGRFIENKDARFNGPQTFAAKKFKEIIVRLEGRRGGDFSQVEHAMVGYMKNWLKRILVSEQDDHYNTKLVTVEGIFMARVFLRKIEALESHGAVLQPAGRDHNFEEEISQMIHFVRRQMKKKTSDSTRDTKEISCGRKILRVLVVDHDPKYLIVHCLQLILFGKIMNLEIKVRAATHGYEAVDLIGDGASFDLIIMDVHSNTNGVETTKELRALGVKARIIGTISSSTISEHQQQAFVQAGLEGCYEKPLKAVVIASNLL